MAKGQKTGGRKKGTPNKLTATAKEAINLAFQGIGGVARLERWAHDNEGEFFTKVWVKLLPQEMQHGGEIKTGGVVILPPVAPK